MKRVSLTLMALLVPVCAVFSELSPRNFIQGIQGPYLIELFGGEKPALPEKADVADSETAADLAMPYCPAALGTCDPGYLTFDYAHMAVTKEIDGDRETHHIEVVEGEKTNRYDWERSPSGFRFINYQYRFAPDLHEGTLEHVLAKLR